MKAKKIRAWAVINRYGLQFLSADQQTALDHATDINSKCAQCGWEPHYHVVPLTGTFTPPKRAAVRGRK